VHSIQSRAKLLTSFIKKACARSDENPGLPKYDEPLSQITDLTGVRIITFFLKTVDQIDYIIRQEFEVIEKIDKSVILEQEERFGYQSIHYLVKLKANRVTLVEYRKFKDLIAEVQVRTILQHAWAEIEHDIQYKSVEVIPATVRRRFMALAGLLEIADREFQAIQHEDERLRDKARESVQKGELDQVEITPDALKAYLDRRMGIDLRMSRYSYDWTARLLRRLGFTNFQQIDECINGYDDYEVSRILTGTSQGQLSRFEYLLLVSMGSNYTQRHPYANDPFWMDVWERSMYSLSQAHIPLGNYDPLTK
jgi:putative GTP pyrophosphokinase